jgi:hypothetical protein
MLLLLWYTDAIFEQSGLFVYLHAMTSDIFLVQDGWTSLVVEKIEEA